MKDFNHLFRVRARFVGWIGQEAGMVHILKALLVMLALACVPVRALAGGVGIGLSSIDDWSTELPLLDLMKSARPWIGHGPDEWEAMSYEELAADGVFDAHGWPTRIPAGVSSIGTLLFTDFEAYVGGAAGRYRVSYEGTGEVGVGGGASNVTIGQNALEFDFVPGNGSVLVDIYVTDPGGTGDYVRNISIVRTDRLQAHAAGALFNPDWLALIDGFEVLRFMDWSETNESPLAHWADRPEPRDASYTVAGAPVELMVALANETGADPWFNMPHLADDDFIRRFAETVRDSLDPGLKAYVEFSNEVWNWSFSQAAWADEQARARWGKDNAWVQFYAARSVEMADIWTEVFGDEAEARLVRVIGTQTGWLGLEEDILEAPLWVKEERRREPPYTHFDAYAVTGYFGGHLGYEDWVPTVKGWIADSTEAAIRDADAMKLEGAERAQYVLDHRFDVATHLAWMHLSGDDRENDEVSDVASLIEETLAYQAEVAADHGLELVAYEGGTHVVAGWEAIEDEELTAFFTHLNYTSEMGALYRQLLDGWKGLDAGVFVAYLDIATPSQWGSWGNLRHLGDKTPRWDALTAARDAAE